MATAILGTPLMGDAIMGVTSVEHLAANQAAGTATVNFSASVEKAVSVIIVGMGTMAAGVALEIAAQAAAGGQGTAQMAPVADYSARAVFAGVGALSVSAERIEGTQRVVMTGIATVTMRASIEAAASMQVNGIGISAGNAVLDLAGRIVATGQATTANTALIERLVSMQASGTGIVVFNAREEFGARSTANGAGVFTPNATAEYTASVSANGSGQFVPDAMLEASGRFVSAGASTVSLAGQIERLSRMASQGNSVIGFNAVAEYAARNVVAGLGTSSFNAQALQFDTIPQVIELGGIRVDVYDVNGNKLEYGPISKIIQCKYSGALDQIGAFELRVPSDEERLAYIGHRYELWIYRQGEGLVFKGEVGRMETIAVDDRFETVITGSSVARKLVRRNTLMGRAYNGSTLAEAVADLLADTTWSAGTLSVPATTLLAEFNGLSRWAALVKVAELFGYHIREDNLNEEVDIGPFGASTGLVFQNVEQASPVLRQNPAFAPISNVSIIEESEDLINRIIPIGGGEGLNMLTLKWSTRAGVQSATGPDGQLYHYIEDATSIATYGLSEEVVKLKDAIPLSNSLAGFQNAANAMFDIANTRLQRKKNPVASYQGEIVGLRHYIAGIPTFKLGDKVRFIFHGVMTTSEGTRVSFKNVNTDVYIMAYERTMNDDGSDSWMFTISTVDRPEETMESKLAERFEAMHAMEVSKRNYTFQAPYILQRISIQPGSTATLYAKLDDNISLLHLAKLTVTVRAVRSNVSTIGTESSSLQTSTNQSATTTSGGSSHNHSITTLVLTSTGSHSHSFEYATAGSFVQTWAPAGGSNSGSLLANHNHASATTDAAVPNNPHSHTVSGGTGAMGGSWVSQLFVTTLTFPTLPPFTDAETSHSHSASSSAISAETSHTHGYSHTHQITIPAHNHALQYGIFTGSNPSNPAITININGVDRTAELGGPFNAVNSEFTLDVTQYLQSGATEQPNRATNTIVFGSSVLCDIEAILRLDLTRSALLPV